VDTNKKKGLDQQVIEPEQIRISVIIPTLNRGDRLRSALTSVRAQTLPPEDYEVIVVDNGSEDATPDVVESMNREGGKAIRYIREERSGLHWARHAGAIVARGKFLAFMDDDATADTGWIEALIGSYSDGKVGCVGGKILPVWEAEPPTWVKDYGPGYLGGLDLGDHSLELKEPAIYGSNLAIRKSTLVQVGGFNPDSFGDFWLGDGETGLLRKVLQAGWKIMYVPEAIVWHVIPASRMTLWYLKRRSANQGTCSSYAAYRQNHPGRGRLFFSASEKGLKGALLEALAFGYKLVGSDQQYHKRIRAAYYWRRLKYDLQLMYDKKLRRLVEKDDWLEDV
jgi:glycosyltransferase involved in cell wall biosynthesis